MCGICGVVWTNPAAAIDGATLGRMTERLHHRGPDDGGAYLDPEQGVALGHRRLSILDLSPSGHQPMTNEDGSVWLTYNGEIYNFPELRRRLEGQGHQFRSQTDSEVIVHLYEEEGPELVRLLRGMFALAIWDRTRRQLFLARDRLGVKPLVYALQPGRLIFASEIKAILEVAGTARELNPLALDHYLALQYVPHPWTIYRGIYKLPPAHTAVWDGTRLRLDRYWEPDFNREVELPDAEYVERVRETLAEATRIRMVSDVPVGAFLSGGLDSTITVGLMQRLSDRPVQTFSIGFPVKQFDETPYARLAARHLGTEHHEFIVEPRGLEVLPELVRHYDEPFADSSAIPTWYVSRLSRRQVTVALTGDAGDECFGGYLRYRAVWLAEWFDRLPSWARAAITTRLWQLLPAPTRQRSPRRRLKRLLAALGDSPERRYVRWVSIFDEAMRGELYCAEFVSRIRDVCAQVLPADDYDGDPARFLLDEYAQCPRRDMVSRTSFVDLMTYLPCDLLTKVDIASMAHGLECRSPFLDHHVVELAVQMPVRLKLRCLDFRGPPLLESKAILKRAFPELLPPAIQRRGKMGFGVPLDHWFRDELRDFLRQTLLDPVCLARGYFRPEAVRRLVEEHQSGRRDHSYRLWALLVFEMWHRESLG